MARIQHATGSAVSTNPITATFSAAVAGNLLVAAVVYRYLSYSDLTATAGWTRAIYAENDVANGGNTPVVVVFYKMAAGGETSVTFTEGASSTGNFLWVVNEYDNFAGSPFDLTATAESSTTLVTSQASGTTGTLTKLPELCFAVWGVRGVITSPSYTNSFTEDFFGSESGYATHPVSMMMATKTVTSTSPVSSTASWTTAGRATGVMVTFGLSVKAPAGVAQASGSALSPGSVTTKPNAGLVSATGTAINASVNTPNSIYASAGVATATATSYAPANTTGPNAGLASATGTGQTASTRVKPTAEAVSATGVALGPSFAEPPGSMLGRTNRGTQSLGYALQTTNTLVSGSFSPAAGALIVVLFDEVTYDAGHSLTMSSTFTGQGSWTVYSAVQPDGYGNYYISRIAWSVCGATPGTGTVTCTRPAGSTYQGMFAEFIEVSGQDTVTPVAQHVENTGVSTSLVLTFAGVPVTSSFVFSNCHDANSTAPGTPSGMTALGSFNSDIGNGGGYSAHAEVLLTASQTNTWNGLGNFVNAGVAIEVVSAPDATGSALPSRRGANIPGMAGRTRRGW